MPQGTFHVVQQHFTHRVYFTNPSGFISLKKTTCLKPVTHKEVSNGLLLCTVGMVEYCSKNLILNFGGTTMKSIFEQNGGTYIKVGKYYIPNVLVPDTKKYTIGKYGRMHAKFIKENRPCI